MKRYLLPALVCLLTCVPVGPVAAARTIEFETTEVTQADVALSPDGQWLVFTLLGHLFRLPVEGGDAEQLTFGPCYDTDPVVSPDGTRVAFVSDRDGSEGNLFVLELSTGEIKQLTHESWIARPVWSLDGERIVYLNLVREAWSELQMPRFSIPDTIPSVVKQVTLSGQESTTLIASPQVIGSLFFLPDGRLAYCKIDLEAGPEGRVQRASTQIKTVEGTILRQLQGYAAPVVPSPARNGFYARRFHPLPWWYTRPTEDLMFLPRSQGSERLIFRLSRPWGWTPRFAVTTDNQNLYLGQSGRIWRISLPDGVQEPIPLRASVTLEIEEPIEPPKIHFMTAGSSTQPRLIRDPRISPDGITLVFVAEGSLWEQNLNSGQTRRLLEQSARLEHPAFSPDGRQLAFSYVKEGKQELRLLDLESLETRTLFSSGCCWLWHPSWSPDGRQVVFGERNFSAIDVKNGTRTRLGQTTDDRAARAHFSSDGRWIYFSSNPDGKGSLYRLSLLEPKDPETMTRLEGPLHDALLSPHGRWVAFRRNDEIWVAPVGKHPVKEEDARRLSLEGGLTFAFTPDGTALVYSVGRRVWRHPLADGEREQIAIRLEVERPLPPPILLRDIRVLDFAAGGFRPEASLLIQEGRIRWMGSEELEAIPAEGVVVVDGNGRFAIPGLFDMHVHATVTNQEALIAYGITSVRDLGGWLPWLSALAALGETSEPVPRYFFSGKPHDWHLQINSEDDARTAVRQWKNWGIHVLKATYPLISWPLLQVVAEEGRRHQLPLIGHGFKGIEVIIKSVTLGYACLEHTTTPGRLYDDILQLLAAAGTYWDPTIATRGNFVLLRDEPERLDDKKLRAFTPGWSIRNAQTFSYFDGLRVIGENELRGRWILQMESVREAQRRGVKLLVGTGAGNTGIFFGSHLHWELEHFVRAGIPPLETLRIATQQAARVVGAGDDLGTLEPGKLADLVLLDANPLEDIRNTQSIWRVIKGGWVFDPEELRPAASASSAHD